MASLMKISLERLILGLLISSAVIGYVISFGKLYLFHVIALLYVSAVLLGAVKISRQAVSSIGALFLVFLFSAISLLWSPDAANGFRYIFYLSNALIIVLALVNYSRSKRELDFTYGVLACFLLLNFLVGILETTGLFRLPMSPYYGEFNTRPSGFNYNINNFGFVFAISFPYLFLYPKFWVRLAGVVLAAWFTFKLESKGFFLALFFFFIFYLMMELKKRSTWYMICLGAIFLIILGATQLISPVELAEKRAFSGFEQIERAIELIGEGSIDANDSTSTRMAMYLYGLQELQSSGYLGVGIAGIGTALAQNTNFFPDADGIYSFHNFFLEMLIDLGLVPFILIFVCYFALVIRLFKISRREGGVKYYAKSSAYALLTALPASISPSSIIYILSFWLILGFSIAVARVSRNHLGAAEVSRDDI